MGERVGWHYGFAAAGIGMILGLVIYLRSRQWLPRHEPISKASDSGSGPLTAPEWKDVAFLIALLPVLAATMIRNQQMFNAFLVWGSQVLDLNFGGVEMPVTWLLSFDAAISAVCLLLMIGVWQVAARLGREPQDITKLAFGATAMALAPLLLVLASSNYQTSGAKVSVIWGVAFEVINEIGFATIVPVGLSLYSRTAPKQIRGLMIGAYYLSLFLCNITVGRLGGMLEGMSGSSFWLMHAAIVGASALSLGLIAMRSRRSV